MHTLRSFSVLAALSIAGAAVAQSQAAPDQSAHDPLRMAAASGDNVGSGMQVKSPSGDVLGRVASIVPSDSNKEGYVVIADLQGIATPVPYRAASAMIQHDTLVVDKSRLANAPKVQQYQAEDGPSDVWQRKADQYWKRSAAGQDETGDVRHE
jgi:hypothetical protein